MLKPKTHNRGLFLKNSVMLSLVVLKLTIGFKTKQCVQVRHVINIQVWPNSEVPICVCIFVRTYIYIIHIRVFVLHMFV